MENKSSKRGTMVTVFLSGCFDLTHTGHLDMLEFAAKQGDYLIVSVASDETLFAIKRKPIICEAERLRMIQALRCVDEAFISRGPNNWDDFQGYLQNIKPDIWVLGSDDTFAPQKEEIAKELGIKIVYKHRYANSYSTTSLIEEIKKSNFQ